MSMAWRAFWWGFSLGVLGGSYAMIWVYSLMN
jgi:hypothetical protein